jgi:hypothetical protein
MKQMMAESKTKNKISQFIDQNVLLSTERRLTMLNQQVLSK